mgnify:CR=1 FL=1
MFTNHETTGIRWRTRKCGENESVAKTNTAGMSDLQRIEKGQHSLVESVALKAPKELLYLAMHYTPQ